MIEHNAQQFRYLVLPEVVDVTLEDGLPAHVDRDVLDEAGKVRTVGSEGRREDRNLVVCNGEK